MSASFNQFVGVGRLTKDVQKVEFANGNSKATGTLVVNSKYRDKNSEVQEESFFIDFDLFGPAAKVLSDYGTKGRELLLSGRLRNESWTNKENEKRSKISLIVDNFQFLGGPAKNGDDKQTEASDNKGKKVGIKAVVSKAKEEEKDPF